MAANRHAATETGLSDAPGRGITVTEMAPMGGPIDASRETTAAFVGRTLRGPLNEPVLLTGVGEFRRRFGGGWSRSSLGPAVQQFFDHGGKRLYVVRVANAARNSMLCLPASGSALVLRSVEPGSTERIRAAVDYDGIDPADDSYFNLTLQRIDPLTGLVIDQEIFRRACYRPDGGDFVGELLLGSGLARVDGPLPTHRPEPTSGRGKAYVEQVQAGGDGHELSDYDIVGSRRAGTGLFALGGAEHFDLLYIPPPGKGRDLGPASILAAERYCRQRGTMLVMDPPAAWDSAQDAAAGLQGGGYASPSLLTYFPRMRVRGEADGALRPVGGALAGLLCRLDRERGSWHDLDEAGLRLGRSLVPAVELDAEDERLLWRSGLNSIVAAGAGRSRVSGAVTTGCGNESQGDFARLPVRRLVLQIVATVDAATRPALFESAESGVAARIRSQVGAYLASLSAEGALADDRFTVHCEVDPVSQHRVAGHGVTVHLGFRPAGCARPTRLTIRQSAAGCRVASTAFAPA